MSNFTKRISWLQPLIGYICMFAGVCCFFNTISLYHERKEMETLYNRVYDDDDFGDSDDEDRAKLKKSRKDYSTHVEKTYTIWMPGLIASCGLLGLGAFVTMRSKENQDK